MAVRRSTRPRATRAALIALTLAVVAAVAPTAAGAATIAGSLAGYEAGPVLAPGGGIVVAERVGRGVLHIRMIEPATGVSRVLDRIAPPADPKTFHRLRLAGSGGIVTATLDLLGDVSGSDAEQATPPLLSSRAFTVLPTLAPLANCDRVNPSFPASIAAAGADGFVALSADDCREASAVHIRNPTGTLTIPAQGGGRFPPPEVRDLRAAGPYVTWTETRFDAGPQSSFVAVRAATGEVLLRAPAARYGLASDGTVAVLAGGCSVRVVSLAPLAQRDVGFPAGLCPGFPTEIAVAGGRAVYPVGGGFAVSDLRGGAHPLGDLAVDIADAGIAFDGRTLYGVRRRCQDELLLAVDTNVAAAAPMPVTPPPSLQTCPVVRRAGAGRLRVASGAVVPVRLRCPAGCQGTLRLVEQRRGRRERIVASVDFASPAGALTLRPKIARFARALAGCRGGLRVAAIVHRNGGATKGLGPYRILSGSSCRRTGGPAFAAPQPWPRP